MRKSLLVFSDPMQTFSDQNCYADVCGNSSTNRDWHEQTLYIKESQNFDLVVNALLMFVIIVQVYYTMQIRLLSGDQTN